MTDFKRFLMLVVVLSAFAGFAVWMQLRHVQTGYAIAKLQQQHNQLEDERMKLVLELEHVNSPQFLEFQNEKFDLGLGRVTGEYFVSRIEVEIGNDALIEVPMMD